MFAVKLLLTQILKLSSMGTDCVVMELKVNKNKDCVDDRMKLTVNPKHD